MQQLLLRDQELTKLRYELEGFQQEVGDLRTGNILLREIMEVGAALEERGEVEG